MDLHAERIKIALIPDEKNWSFDNIAKQIKKNLSSQFDFKIVPYVKYLLKTSKFYNEIEECDILHFFWRDTIRDMQLSNFFDWSKEKNKIISTAVYDHLLLGDDEIIERKDLFNNTFYYVCSERLKQIYDNIDIYNKPAMVIEDGVDPGLFYPVNIERLKANKRLIAGWAGNSKWDLDYDLKGLKTIIKPTVEQLKKSGYSIKGVYRDRKNGYVPHNKMVNYYSKIDVLVCMSTTEGTPNPVLEAMACGVPIITTDVGIIPQVFGEKQKQFIIKDRSTDCLKKAILQLYKDRDLLWELSQENLKQVENWHWPKQCIKFKKYFEILASHL